MDISRIPSLLDEMAAIGTRILVITGGEPFLHPHLFDVVRQARARGLGVNVTTNGTRIDARWDELVASGLDSVSVSLDGTERTHDALRGRPGVYREAMEGVRRLLQRGGIAVSLHFVVTSRNLEDLPQIWQLARTLGVGFDFWPVNHAPDLVLRTPEARTRYREVVQALASQDPTVAARRDYLLAGLDYHAGTLGPVRCRGLVDQYGVLPDGSLMPCCVWGHADLVVGNVFETPLSRLWNGEATLRVRSRIQERGCTAGCFNHSLHAFTRVTGLPFALPHSA